MPGRLPPIQKTRETQPSSTVEYQDTEENIKSNRIETHKGTKTKKEKSPPQVHPPASFDGLDSTTTFHSLYAERIQIIESTDDSILPSVSNNQVNIANAGPANVATAAFASLTAAVATCALLHPLDLIKTRMQVAAVAPAAVPAYTSSIAAIHQIWGLEGVRGLYKGLVATMIASGMSWGVFRYLFDVTRYSITPATNVNRTVTSQDVKLRTNIVAGFTAGLASTCLVHPFWLVKTRLEMQAHETKRAGWFQYTGWRHCVRSIYYADGVRGFYIGLGPAISLVPHAALQILMYEELKRRAIRRRQKLTGADETYASESPENVSLLSLESQDDSELQQTLSIPSIYPFMWGAMSKFVAVCATYPLQVLRSRQQMLNSNVADVNFLRIGRDMVKNEGLLSIYRGFGTHIQRSCFYNGLVFLIFEKLMTVKEE